VDVQTVSFQRPAPRYSFPYSCCWASSWQLSAGSCGLPVVVVPVLWRPDAARASRLAAVIVEHAHEDGHGHREGERDDEQPERRRERAGLAFAAVLVLLAAPAGAGLVATWCCHRILAFSDPGASPPAPRVADHDRPIGVLHKDTLCEYDRAQTASPSGRTSTEPSVIAGIRAAHSSACSILLDEAAGVVSTAGHAGLPAWRPNQMEG
jgi:hypothetical protein